MKGIIIIALSFISFTGVGQDFKQDKNGSLTLSVNKIKSGTINNKVTIGEIFYPDSNFNCLSPLGSPTKTREDHHIAGDDHWFYYDNLTLFYSNTSDGRMKLSMIEIEGRGNDFISLHKSNKVLTTNKAIRQMTGNQLASISENDRIVAEFPDDEGSRIEFENSNGLTQKIKIYFL